MILIKLLFHSFLNTITVIFKKMERMNIDEYKKSVGIHNSRGSSSIHKNNEKPSIESAYDTAIQTLRDLQSFNGDLFLGRSRFKLKIGLGTENKSSADHTNVYKGIEDSLNNIAWYDDKQNKIWNDRLFGTKQIGGCIDLRNMNFEGI